MSHHEVFGTKFGLYFKTWFKRTDTNPNSHIALTNWGRVTHICVNKLTIIGSDNGLSPGQRQAIIWTNAGILLIGPLGTNFSEVLSDIHAFSFKKMHLKMSSAKWRPFCLGLNVLSTVEFHLLYITQTRLPLVYKTNSSSRGFSGDYHHFRGTHRVWHLQLPSGKHTARLKLYQPFVGSAKNPKYCQCQITLTCCNRFLQISND